MSINTQRRVESGKALTAYVVSLCVHHKQYTLPYVTTYMYESLFMVRYEQYELICTILKNRGLFSRNLPLPLSLGDLFDHFFFNYSI